MMSSTVAKMGRNTPLNKLRPGVFRTISNLLDPDRKWEDLADHIRRRNGQHKFDYQQIRLLHLAYQRPNGSPTRDLLDAWSMDNPTVDQLIEVALEAELFVVADYVTVSVLGEAPDYRQGVSPNVTERIEIGPQIVVGSPEPPSLGEIPPFSPYTGSTAENNNSNQTNISNNHQEPCSPTSNADTEHRPNNSKPFPPTINSDLQQEKEISRKQKCLNWEKPDTKVEKVSHVSCEKHQELVKQCAAWSPGCSALQFDYDSLSSITNRFNGTDFKDGGNFIGRGGFGEVFYGKISSMEVAVKRLAIENVQDHSKKQFHNEIFILTSFNYEHLLPLVGYSDDNGLSLVYLYMPKGSLEDRLACQGGTLPLTVQQRISIAKGVARGINHLHTAGIKEIIHRDIKSANVLLDSNWVAKIGDCGLGHFGPTDPNRSHTLTDIVSGTSVYISPEYRNWEVSVKVDAYAYGVVLLEILTGEQAFDADREDKDLTVHIDENCDDIMTMLDQCGGEWPESTARAIFNMSQRLLKYKARRPKIAEVLLEIEDWPET